MPMLRATRSNDRASPFTTQRVCLLIEEGGRMAKGRNEHVDVEASRVVGMRMGVGGL